MCLAQRFFFLLGCGFHHFYLSQWWKWRKKKTELLVQNPFNLKRNFCSNNANPIIIFQVINFHTHTHTSGMCFSLLLSPPFGFNGWVSKQLKTNFFFLLLLFFFFFSSSPFHFFFIAWIHLLAMNNSTRREKQKSGGKSISIGMLQFKRVITVAHEILLH